MCVCAVFVCLRVCSFVTCVSAFLPTCHLCCACHLPACSSMLTNACHKTPSSQGLNVALYWKNPDPRSFVNVVPTSAISGEGLPDLLQLMVCVCMLVCACVSACPSVCAPLFVPLWLSCTSHTQHTSYDTNTTHNAHNTHINTHRSSSPKQ